MWIAIKFEEVWVFGANEIVTITDNAYTHKQLLVMESIIMQGLDFRLISPSSYDFSHYYLKRLEFEDETLHPLVLYILEIQLQKYEVLVYPASLRAISSIFIALKTLNAPDCKVAEWLRNITYSQDKLVPSSLGSFCSYKKKKKNVFDKLV